VFTARYALSPYVKQIRFVFKGLRKRIKESIVSAVISQNTYKSCEQVANFECLGRTLIKSNLHARKKLKAD
jgi:hypothetical protein